MLHFRFLFTLGCCQLALVAHAQTALPLPLNIRQAIDRGTRTLTGQPGPRYWQNHADYTIRVRFDPVTRLVSGSESIVYANNSPDTLRQLLFKLYPNLYEKGAERMMSVQPEDLTDGVSVTNLAIDGIGAEAARNSRRRRGAGGTDMSVPVQPMVPGRSLTVTLDFSYTLNRTSHIRTGQVDSGAYFVAYFFPRIAVYDDIDGWNRIPYLGPQEFYNDFCNFSVSVTVPGNFIVWGTGDLVNRRTVLSDIYNRRIDSAERGDGIVTVIDSADLTRKGITRDPDSNTWVFDARNVTDFVFAISNHYVWKSSSLIVDTASGRRTRVDAAFNPAHRDYDEVVVFARKTVQAMSYSFPAWPYPYPHETVFDGLDQMEYPMMVNDNPLQNRAEAIELTDHEIFHTFFPFYMGVNETKYAWMDEGWATIGEWVISPLIDSTIVDGYGVEPYARGAGREDDLPVITLSTQETGNDYFLNSYPKPAMGYLYARDILGDSLFLRGIHRYMRDWHGKHPIPTDFFQSMNAGSGVDLDWFWRRWYYENGYPDLAIASVHRRKNTWTVTVVNKGGKPLPVDLTIEYADGSTEKIHRSADVWEKEAVLTLTFGSAKTIRTVRLGSTYTPDSFPADNMVEVR